MRASVGLAVGLGMLSMAGAAAAQCDPWVCSNPPRSAAPIYHLKGSSKFGKTPTDAFMCKARAVLHGSRPATENSTRR
jgi:hypothetical protein